MEKTVKVKVDCPYSDKCTDLDKLCESCRNNKNRSYYESCCYYPYYYPYFPYWYPNYPYTITWHTTGSYYQEANTLTSK